MESPPRFATEDQVQAFFATTHVEGFQWLTRNPFRYKLFMAGVNYMNEHPELEMWFDIKMPGSEANTILASLFQAMGGERFEDYSPDDIVAVLAMFARYTFRCGREEEGEDE